MKITVKTSGGFAGIQMPAKVLESDDASVRTLLTEAMEADVTKDVVSGMDMKQYDINIEDGDKKQDFSFTNRLLPPAIQALVDYVIDHDK